MTDLNFEQLAERATNLEKEAARIRDYIQTHAEFDLVIHSQCHEILTCVSRLEMHVLNMVIELHEATAKQIATYVGLSFLEGRDATNFVLAILRKLEREGKCSAYPKGKNTLWYATIDRKVAKLISI